MQAWSSIRASRYSCPGPSRRYPARSDDRWEACFGGSKCERILAPRVGWRGIRALAGLHGNGQHNADLQAASRSIIESNLAAVTLHDGLRHRQTQADAACRAIARFIMPVVRTKDAIQSFRRNARATTARISVVAKRRAMVSRGHAGSFIRGSPPAQKGIHRCVPCRSARDSWVRLPACNEGGLPAGRYCDLPGFTARWSGCPFCRPAQHRFNTSQQFPLIERFG